MTRSSKDYILPEVMAKKAKLFGEILHPRLPSMPLTFNLKTIEFCYG